MQAFKLNILSKKLIIEKSNKEIEKNNKRKLNKSFKIVFAKQD